MKKKKKIVFETSQEVSAKIMQKKEKKVRISHYPSANVLISSFFFFFSVRKKSN